MPLVAKMHFRFWELFGSKTFIRKSNQSAERTKDRMGQFSSLRGDLHIVITESNEPIPKAHRVFDRNFETSL